MVNALQLAQAFSSVKSMMLRIDRLQERIRLSGEFRSEHVLQVKAEMDQSGSLSVLDLAEVDLVDAEAIHFLNSCEARGGSGVNASAYTRPWKGHERDRPAHQHRQEERPSKPQ